MVRCNVTTVGRGGAALVGAAGLMALVTTAQAQGRVKTAVLPSQAAQQLAQISHVGLPAGTASYAALLAMNAGRQDSTVEIAGRSYPLAIRLGAMVSPRVKFVGGADLTVPRLGFGSNWVGRIDAEAIVSANLGGNSTLVPLTFDQVYQKSDKLYFGAGLGPYFGDTTRLGGKIFVGSRFDPQTSGEASLHFVGGGDPLFILQVRRSF